MNESGAKPKLGIFFSPGQEFHKLLANVRKQRPSAEIIAIVPKSYVMSDEEMECVDRALHRAYDNFPPRRPIRVSRLIRSLRAEGFMEFVVLFDTFKLRSLASLSGADRCYCWASYGKVEPLESSFARAAASTSADAARAWLRYAKVCFAVYGRSAKK
jgi:hypothetical protein